MSVSGLNEAQIGELAQQLFAKFEQRQQVAKVTDPRTVRDLVDRFVKVEIGANPKARKPRRADWRAIVSHIPYILDMVFEWEGEKVKLGDLRYETVTLAVGAAWMFELANQLTVRTKKLPKAQHKTLSPGYQNRVLATLQAVFKWHVKEKSIPGNPARGWPRAHDPDGARRGHCTEEDFAELVAAAHPTLRDMMHLSCRAGGMRLDEVRLLQIHEVDWERKVIELKGERVKNREPKLIPLVSDVFEMLENRRKTVPGTYLFPLPSKAEGTPPSATTCQYWMRAARDKSGVVLNNKELPVFHHMRHKWAIDETAKKTPASVIGDVGGWKTDRMLRRYTKLASVEQIEVAREMMETRPGEVVLPGAPAPVNAVHACPICEGGYATLREAADCEDACRLRRSRTMSPLARRRGPAGAGRAGRGKLGAVG